MTKNQLKHTITSAIIAAREMDAKRTEKHLTLALGAIDIDMPQHKDDDPRSPMLQHLSGQVTEGGGDETLAP